MSFTLDPTTTIGQVRLKITDRDSANPIFQDADIEAFLLMEGSSVLRASAAALEAIAIDQALVLKVVKILGQSTDGAKLADTLFKIATRYRDLADFSDAASGDLFDWATFVDDPFASREYLGKAIESGAL